MDIGSLCISTVSQSTAFENALMPISLANGFQLEIRPVNMNTSRVWVVRVLTPEQPYWRDVCAAETATLALMGAASRIVGAMDRDP